MASTYINLPQIGLEDESLLALENVTVTVGSSVEVSNDVGNPLPINGTVEITNDVGNPIPVSATDLDIRNLAFATDKVDASGSEVTLATTTVQSFETLTLSVEVVNEVEISNDSGNPIPVSGTVAATQSGTWNVNDVSGIISLPTGASTSAKQDTIIGHVDGLEGLLTTIESNQLPDNHQVTANQGGTWNINDVSGTVSLPTGASTLAEQQTQTASLSILDDWDEIDRAKVNTIAGQVGVQAGAGAVSTNTQRVVIVTDQTVIPVSDNGASLTIDGTVAAIQSGTWNINDISGTVSLPTGAATEVKQDTGNTSLGSIDTKLSSQATAANQTTIIGHVDGIETSLTTMIGHVDGLEGQLTTITGHVDGLEGQLTTIAGHLDGVETSLSNIDTGIPAALGQTTMSASMPVTIASNQSIITGPPNSAVTSVSGSATNVTLLASNTNRVGASFYNDSNVNLYLKLGATASTSSFTVRLEKEAYYELSGPAYTGIIDGIWASAAGAVRITEITRA